MGEQELGIADVSPHGLRQHLLSIQVQGREKGSQLGQGSSLQGASRGVGETELKGWQGPQMPSFLMPSCWH